jgi:hypothetical protein
VLLGHQPRRGLPLVFFSLEEYEAVDWDALSSVYVTVRGTLTLYKGRPQIVIDKAAQISAK